MRLLILASAVLLLASCDRHRAFSEAEQNAMKLEQVKTGFSTFVKDPSSVQYGAIWAADSLAVCGFYNAKNSFGAYTGFTPFVIVGDRVLTAEQDLAGMFAENWSHSCIKKGRVIQPGTPAPPWA